jgi:hypothetical protein
MEWGEPSLMVKFAWIAPGEVSGLDSEVPQDILPSGKQEEFNCPLVAIVPAGYHYQVVLPHQRRNEITLDRSEERLRIQALRHCNCQTIGHPIARAPVRHAKGLPWARDTGVR